MRKSTVPHRHLYCWKGGWVLDGFLLRSVAVVQMVCSLSLVFFTRLVAIIPDTSYLLYICQIHVDSRPWTIYHYILQCQHVSLYSALAPTDVGSNCAHNEDQSTLITGFEKTISLPGRYTVTLHQSCKQGWIGVGKKTRSCCSIASATAVGSPCCWCSSKAFTDQDGEGIGCLGKRLCVSFRGRLSFVQRIVTDAIAVVKTRNL